MLLFVAALVVHALLEFPLHYAYFLLPLGLMLGALNMTLAFRPLWTTSGWPTVIALALSAGALTITTYDYLRVEDNFFSLRFEHQRLARPASQTAPEVVALTQLQDMIWLARVNPAQSHAEQDLDRARRTTMLLPSLMAKYKLATMYALAGQPGRAQYWVVVMTRMNRLDARTVRNLQRHWQEQAAVYPAMAQVTWPVEK